MSDGQGRSSVDLGGRRVDVSVVIPVYRNAPTLRELFSRIRCALEPDFHFQAIFVVDGCPDGSEVMLREMARTDERIGGVVLGCNVGQNRAILAGLHYALGESVVIMDADLQDPPEPIPRLLAGLGRHDVVFAGRRGSYEPLVRRLCSRIFKRALHWTSRRRIPADAGLFVAMTEKARKRLLELEGRGTYVIEMLGRTDLRLSSTPVTRTSSPSGSSYSWTGRLKIGWSALTDALRFHVARQRPLAVRVEPARAVELIGSLDEAVGVRLSSGGIENVVCAGAQADC